MWAVAPQPGLPATGSCMVDGRRGRASTPALLWALVTTVGLAHPVRSWAGPPSDAASAFTLEVDVVPSGLDSAALRDAIYGDAAARLDRLGYEIRDRAGADISIRVDWADEAQMVFMVTVTAERNGEIFVQDKGQCPQCGTPELFEQIGESLGVIVTELESEPSAAAQAPAPEPPVPADQPEAPAPRSRSSHGLGAMGWIGVGLASAGLVVGGIGIGVWSRGRHEVPKEDDATLLLVTDYRPPGIALAVVGSVVLTSGLALVITDGVRRRSRARLGAGPVPGGAALVVGGSF